MRKRLAACILAASAAAALAPYGAAPPSPARKAAALAQAGTAAQLDLVEARARRALAAPAGELFTRLEPPPERHTSAPQPGAPPREAAPEMAYRFAGRSQRAGDSRVYLLRGAALLEAREGELLDDGWRVTRIRPDHIVLEHAQAGAERRIELSPAATPGAAAATAPADR